ncbi:hypothetical protein [Flavisolibacter ginsenosidimutans]|uniref:TonB C-terminal domain-containing protein n=1 Tax=Flavisolibacter ginsenosidimutans TaxID=661481 RepID=A0A5B8UK28_9BACT|nr:hypothetical protein [Flavisolibacter ginsenosidimutans]QEC56752.1 hypothetical protein FSB75_12865 [Flavisolibacter ginsenosidimutans]
MKKGILFFLLIAAFAANAQQKQSLKDLLYGGKLKADSNSVVRKNEDLSARIDTATKKQAEPEAPKAVTPATSEPQKTETATTNTATSGEATDSSITTTAAAKPAPVKSTNKIWKEYADSLTKVLSAEVLPSKKIKKDTYFITVEYEINTDGTVNVLNLTSSPENAFLQSEVKTRMDLGTPQLAPVLDSTGKARKVKRRTSFSLTKE